MVDSFKRRKALLRKKTLATTPDAHDRDHRITTTQLG
jgi:hypothetical protein